jgi:OmpA-OmpF porin, OOP family
VKKIAAAMALSTVFATPAFAGGFFIGGDLGIAAGYPDRKEEVGNGLIGAGATYVSVTQKMASIALDLHGGQWVTEQFGWEIGYDALGSADGDWTSSGASTGSYKYTASAYHFALLGGIPVGGRGKLFGKAGLFSASTKEEVSNTGGYHSSITQSSSGLLLGGGYELSFNERVAGRAGITLFNGVKFNDFTNNQTDKKTLVQVAVGVNYKF